VQKKEGSNLFVMFTAVSDLYLAGQTIPMRNGLLLVPSIITLKKIKNDSKKLLYTKPFWLRCPAAKN